MTLFGPKKRGPPPINCKWGEGEEERGDRGRKRKGGGGKEKGGKEAKREIRMERRREGGRRE